ncbi:MAG: oligosaccharide flippase family protein [Microgenomates group bacterium]
MNRTIKKYFAAGIVSGVLVLVVTKALQLGLKLIVARLGVEEFGSYYYFISLYTSFVAIASLGIPMSITRFLAYYGGKKQEQMRSYIIQSAMILMGIIAVVLTGSLMLCVQRFAGYLAAAAYTTSLWLLVCSIPFSFLIVSIKAGLLGQLQIKKSYFIDGLTALITFSCISVGLFVFHAGVAGALYAYALSILITAVISVYLFRSYIPFSSFSFRISKEFVHYTWPVSVSEIMTASSTILYVTILKYYGGDNEVGLYGLAVTIASLVNIFPQIILPVFFPVISTLFSQGVSIREVYKKTVLLLIITSLVSAVVLLLGSRLGTSLFFGSSYFAALPMVPYFIAAYMIYILFVWYNRQLLDMAGLTKINLLLTGIRIIITTLVLFLSVPAISGMHMAIAFGIGWLIEGLLCLSLIRQKRLLI